MTGVTVNPLTALLLQIRKGATTSFKTGLEQLAQDEQESVMTEIEQFTSGTWTIPTDAELKDAERSANRKSRRK